MKYPHQMTINGKGGDGLKKLKDVRLHGKFESIFDVSETKERADFLRKQMKWLDEQLNEIDGWTKEQHGH